MKFRYSVKLNGRTCHFPFRYILYRSIIDKIYLKHFSLYLLHFIRNSKKQFCFFFFFTFDLGDALSLICTVGDRLASLSISTYVEKLLMFLPNINTIATFLRPGECLPQTLHKWADRQTNTRSSVQNFVLSKNVYARLSI